MIVPFFYYLHHDGDGDEDVEHLLGQGIQEDVAQRIAGSRPFYEVTVDCTYDTDTGKITYGKVEST